jgi:hypothetical protein
MSSLVVLAPGPRVSEGASVSARLHRLWLRIVERPWNTLAIVPTDDDIAPWEVARTLAIVAEEHDQRPIRLVDATIDIAHLQRTVAMLQAVPEDRHVIIAVEAMSANAVSLPIARAAAAVLIVARLGHTRQKSVLELIDAVGRQRVIGCVLVE